MLASLLSLDQPSEKHTRVVALCMMMMCHLLPVFICSVASIIVFERQVRDAKAEFKVFMTKERKPLEFAGLNSKTTIGMLCGHCSFGIAALVYLETDPLTTR